MNIERKSHSTSVPPVPAAQPAARRTMVGGRTVLHLPGQRPLTRPATEQASGSSRRDGKPVADREQKHGPLPSSAAGKRKREEEEQAFVAALPPTSSSSSSSSPSLDSAATRRAQAEAFIDAHAGVLDCENARSSCEKVFAAALKEKRGPADIAEISRALRDRFGGAVLDAQTARAWAEAVTCLGMGMGMDDPDDYTLQLAAMLHGLTHEGPAATERTHIRHLAALSDGARSAAVAARCLAAEPDSHDLRFERLLRASVPALAAALDGPQIARDHLQALLRQWCRPQAYPQHLIDTLQVDELSEGEAMKRARLAIGAQRQIIASVRHAGGLAQEHWVALVEHALALQTGLETPTRARLVEQLARDGRAPALLQHLLAATDLRLDDVGEACWAAGLTLMDEEGVELNEDEFGNVERLPSSACIDVALRASYLPERAKQWTRIGMMLTRLRTLASAGPLQQLERFSAAMASLLPDNGEARTRLTAMLTAPLADRDTKASHVIAMASGHARGSLPDAPAQDDAAAVQAHQASIHALKQTLCEGAGPQAAAVGLGVELFADPRSFVARYGMSGAQAAFGDAPEAQRSAWRALPAQQQLQLVGAALLASQERDPDPVDAALEWLKWAPFPQDPEAALRFPELRAEMMIALFRVAPSLGAHHWHAARALVQGDSAELVALRSGAPAGEKPVLSLRHANIALQLTQLYGEFKRGSGMAALLSTADAAALGREKVLGFMALLNAELDEWNQGLGSRAAMKTLPDLFAADLARLEQVAGSLWPSEQASASSSSSSSSVS